MKTRPQFSLRVLMGILLCISLLFGWGHIRVRKAESDRRIVAVLRASFECEVQFGPTSESLLEWALRRSLGNEVAGTARVIGLRNGNLTQDDWNCLALLTDLDALQLSNFTLKTSKEVEHIRRLRLRTLSVRSVELNTDVVAALPKLRGLDVLWLGSDNGLLPAEIHRLKLELPTTEVMYLRSKE